MAIKLIITDTIEEFRAVADSYNLLDGYTIEIGASASIEEIPVPAPQPVTIQYEELVERPNLAYHKGNLRSEHKAAIAIELEIFEHSLQAASDRLKIKPKTVRYWADHFNESGSALKYFQDNNFSALQEYRDMLHAIRRDDTQNTYNIRARAAAAYKEATQIKFSV